MEAITSKRQYRKRAMLAVPNAVEEGADTSSLDTGDGQVSGIGIAAQAVDVRQGEGWNSFVSRVISLHERTGFSVRHVWCDKPEKAVIEHHNGSIVVSQGKEIAVLKDGESVEI